MNGVKICSKFKQLNSLFFHMQIEESFAEKFLFLCIFLVFNHQSANIKEPLRWSQTKIGIKPFEMSI